MDAPAYSTLSEVSPSIFRAYDIRGVVGETLNPDILYTLGRAVGTEADRRDLKQFVVGRDGRLSSPELFSALCAGLVDSGCRVIDVGVVSSPILYFAVQHLNINSGVMLTGSHNPANYNGIKVLLDNQSLTEREITSLYHTIQANEFVKATGEITQSKIVPEYIAHIVNSVKLSRPMKVVIDCGNGVASVAAPEIFQRLGCELISLYSEVDGNFPNHHPDPSRVENLADLIKAVLDNQADVGIAFDGDADRLGVVTNTGEIIWPDRQMMLFSVDVLKRQPGADIVFDVKCTRHLPEVIEQYGGTPHRWKTGHSLIKRRMQDLNAALAGEMSGHIFFKERWFGFDDGIYAATRLLEIVSAQDKTVDEIFEAFPNSINTEEIKLPVAENDKFDLINKIIAKADFKEASVNTIDGIRVEFPNGWGLIRASNTTPCLTLRFEADTQEDLNAIQQQFKTLILAINPSLEIPW